MFKKVESMSETGHHFHRMTIPVILNALILVSCTGLGQVVPAPMVFEEQSKELLKIVPLGTPKTEAIQKLEAAGISGEFATSPSIYYCDLWERENGKRWHLNVALLFNEAGALYKTRPAQADVSWKSETNSASGENGEQ
ncbi:MAG: hypothetical protein K0U86_15140 [Planctomycetes bacterium]|nr:hypothetical protein [Planctomycetota bacterium]MCH9726233.1 hypothetical protein [Planctomycetota bacterium]MCH9775738.1 hypothetical protein [Planctomycetota bacterium]MCH9791776.1 hypothetical protein [Planctomycetota bacterium]